MSRVDDSMNLKGFKGQSDLRLRDATVLPAEAHRRNKRVQPHSVVTCL
jgi:hypothetical protein